MEISVMIRSRSCLGSTILVRRREPAVQLESCADQRYVCKRLGKIAEVFSGRTKLLREQPEMIRITQHSFKQEPRPTDIARTSETFDIPERAHTEGAFFSGEAVRSPIAIH